MEQMNMTHNYENQRMEWFEYRGKTEQTLTFFLLLKSLIRPANLSLPECFKRRND